MRLVFPPVPAAIIASILYGALLSAFPLHVARGLMAGGLLGYVCYDLIHFYIHHATPTLAYFAELKQLHMKHHYREFNQGEENVVYYVMCVCVCVYAIILLLLIIIILSFWYLQHVLGLCVWNSVSRKACVAKFKHM